MSDSPGSFAPLRHRSFRWYFVASSVNTAGTTMSGVALAFAVLSISDSPRALGYAGVLMTSGASYLVICLLVLLSRSVRDLRRVPVTTAG